MAQAVFAVELRMFVDRPLCGCMWCVCGVCVTERQTERNVFCMHTVYSGAHVLYM